MKTISNHGYAFQKTRWLVLARLIDFCVSALTVFKKHRIIPSAPRKILVSQIAHLGDVVIALSLLEPLRKQYPYAEIYFLCGSWAEPLLHGNPHIKGVITYDAFFLQRSGGIFHRIFTAVKSFIRARACLRAEKFDMALDCRVYFPNSLPLLYMGGCSCICGYRTACFGPLLDHDAAWEENVHEAQRLLNLLPGPKREPGVPDLAYLTMHDEKFLATVSLEGKIYAVTQVGAGLPVKNMPVEKWAAIVNYLLSLGIYVVFTGTAKERKTADAIIATISKDKYPQIKNLCGNTQFTELAALINKAALTIAPDSFACHLSAALGRRTVVLFSGIVDERHWHPLGPNVRVVKADCACSPCYSKTGCKTMACISGMTEQCIISAIREIWA